MRLPASPFRTLLAAACLLTLAVLPASAGTVKYPKAKPTFTMEIPEDWTFEEEDNDMHELTLKPASGDYEIKILTLGAGLGDVKSALTKVVKATLANPKLTDTKSRDPQEVKTPSGMAVAVCSAKCKIDGQDILYSFATFAPTKGNVCELAAYATTETASKEAEGIAEKMLGSVKPLK